MSKVIQFPSPPNKEPPLDHELDVARLCMENLISTLIDYRYMPEPDTQLFDDVAICYSIIYAALLREDGLPHQWHEMMDEIIKETKVL